MKPTSSMPHDHSGDHVLVARSRPATRPTVAGHRDIAQWGRRRSGVTSATRPRHAAPADDDPRGPHSQRLLDQSAQRDLAGAVEVRWVSLRRHNVGERQRKHEPLFAAQVSPAPTCSYGREAAREGGLPIPREDRQLVLMDFSEAHEWAAGGRKANLLLGNGFSMAYDPQRFSYTALATQAIDEDRLPDTAVQLMKASGRPDFEWVMRQLESTAETLATLDPKGYRALVEQLQRDIAMLREALAHSIAGLHPDRPFDIGEESYQRVRTFLDSFASIYTVSYDLLLYWALMQDLTDHGPRWSDDGFRDSGIAGDETVLWNIYDTGTQNVHYLHGALHLFIGDDGLRKITWKRTERALIDQVRDQLAARRYPLYVAEAKSPAKLARINENGYLTRALRSLASCNHGLVVLGHSLDPNDDHIFEAVVRSTVARLAVSLFGDPNSETNLLIQRRAHDLTVQRKQLGRRTELAVEFFDAGSVPLW